MSESVREPKSTSEKMLEQRAQLTETLVSLVGWIVLIVPIVLIAVIIFAAVTQPNSSVFVAAKIGLILLGVVLLFCMIAFPHLLGQAVIHRELNMYRAMLFTRVPTVLQ